MVFGCREEKLQIRWKWGENGELNTVSSHLYLETTVSDSWSWTNARESKGSNSSMAMLALMKLGKGNGIPTKWKYNHSLRNLLSQFYYMEV